MVNNSMNIFIQFIERCSKKKIIVQEMVTASNKFRKFGISAGFLDSPMNKQIESGIIVEDKDRPGWFMFKLINQPDNEEVNNVSNF